MDDQLKLALRKTLEPKVETWTVVLSGIECDNTSIVTLRSELVASIGFPNTGSLTMLQWVFDEYWRVPAPLVPAAYDARRDIQVSA